MLLIKIQRNDFDPGLIYNGVARDRADIGAKIAFTGMVRDFFKSVEVSGLYIEHYPVMAEKQLNRICKMAMKRWNIKQIHLIHRVGFLKPGDNIVNLVLVSNSRGEVFEGGSFIMDYLKSDAPFWKKEHRETGSTWVNQNLDDIAKKDSW